MPSTTTKSLPAPCILVKRNFIERLSPIARNHGGAGCTPDLLRPPGSMPASVQVGFAGRPGLEAFVAEQVLLGHLEHSLLDEGIDPPGRGDQVRAGVVVPGRIEGDDIA